MCVLYGSKINTTYTRRCKINTVINNVSSFINDYFKRIHTFIIRVCRPQLKHRLLHPIFIHLVVRRPRVFSIRTFFLPSYFQLKLSPCFVFSLPSLFFTSSFVSISDHALSHTVSRRRVRHLTLQTYQVTNINKCLGLAACTFPVSKFVKVSHSNLLVIRKNYIETVITHLYSKF